MQLPAANFSRHGIFGLKPQNEHKEEKIVLDINRPISDEYAEAMFGLQNTLEATLNKYNIKKTEITKENRFSMIAMESLMKVLNDQTLVDHHVTVLNAINFLVNCIGKDTY